MSEELEESHQSSPATRNPLAIELFGEVRKSWGWILVFGVLFIILGTIGLRMSVGLTLAGVLFCGWLALIGGAFQLVEDGSVTAGCTTSRLFDRAPGRFP